MVQARRPLGNRDGTKQLYGIRPSHVPMRRRLPLSHSSKEMVALPCQTVDASARQFLSLSGAHLRISVPETSPCHRQAKQIGKLDPRKVTLQPSGAFAAESRPRRTRDRQSKRIGSVRRRLCKWAASAGPFTFESLGHRRGGQSKRMRSCLCRSGILAGSRRRC